MTCDHIGKFDGHNINWKVIESIDLRSKGSSALAVNMFYSRHRIKVTLITMVMRFHFQVPSIHCNYIHAMSDAYPA